ISDFTYKAIANRIVYVNSTPLMRRAPVVATRYRVIVVGSNGVLRWGRESVRSEPPPGEIEAVTLLDQAGNGVAAESGYFMAFDHRPGGFLVVPADNLSTARGVFAVRVDRLGTVLAL